jgi:8-oxo-dGTP diphosphatase
VVGLARPFGARVLLNGGPPIGEGIHYTAAQLMTLEKKASAGLTGASCHTRADLERAMALELDFAVLGPVMPTATHPGAATLGWNGFAALAAGASIPIYAIGGLRRDDLPAARRAGAHGIAMISGSWR